MNITEIKQTLKNPEYDFLKTNPKLGNNIILLGLGGSHAYGTNTPTSDLDIRGIYVNPIEELYGTCPDSEQVVDITTDTTVYSLKKMMHLLASCNPNTIELLGLKDDQYLTATDEGRLLLEQKEIFLSKKAIYTFGQYAASQLNRLINKSGRSKSMLLENEQRSLSKTMRGIEERHHKGNIRVKFNVQDSSIKMDFVTEQMDINELSSILSEINNIHKDYTKSKRNDKAIEHNKLNKHMMHLLRLYMMGIDILKYHNIITYREKEHDLLMDIRNSKYLKDDNATPTDEFLKLLDDYTKEFDDAARNTTLPEQPDFHKINELSIQINKQLH